MRKNRFAALAVIDRAAGQVAADRYAQNGRRLKGTVRTPTHDAQLVANLHHRGPDVVEELNFGDGLEPPRGHADGTADYGGLRQGRVENTVVAVLALQAGGGFENAALALDLLQIDFAAGVGDVLAENGNALIPGHFVGERCRDHFDHGLGRAMELRLSFKCGRSGVDFRRINIDENRIDLWLFGSQRFVSGVADFLIDFGFEGFDLFLVEDAFSNKEQREFGNRITVRLGFALFGGLVKFLVVGKRMGIRARDVRMNESGPATLAAVLNGGLADRIAFERIRAIAFRNVQAGEAAGEF